MFHSCSHSQWFALALLASAFFFAAATPQRTKVQSSAVLLDTDRQEIVIRQNASVVLLPGAGHCGEKISHPSTVAVLDCPMECPYIRPDTAHFCSFSCVVKEDCGNRNPLTSFANPLTSMCSPCMVAGCVSCGKSKYECLKCNTFLDLAEDGSCVQPYNYLWEYTYCAVLCFGAIALLYVIHLAWRPEVNTLALERAESHRRNCKLFQKTDNRNRTYPLDTNLCSQVVSGAAIRLHFAWQRNVIIWAFVVVLSFFILSRMSHYSLDHDTHPSDGDVFEACAAAGGTQLAKEVMVADQLYLYLIVALYIFSTIGSLLMLVQQRNTIRSAGDTDLMRHFALQASGFPPCKGDAKLEDQYKIFFQKAFPAASVLGVSIAWDTRHSNVNADSQVDLERQVDAELDALDRDRDMQLGNRYGHSKRQDLEGGQREEDQRNCCHSIDSVLLKALSTNSEPDKSLDKSQIVTELERLTTTGHVFCVFETRADRDKARAQGSLNYPDPTKEGGSEIVLTRTGHDPENQLWGNLKNQSRREYLWEKGRRSVACGLGLFIGVTLWSMLVYAPISGYLLSFQRSPGVQHAHWWDEFTQGLLLSVPILLSNQILYAVCEALAAKIHFTSKGMRDTAYVVMYTLFITYQTVLDVAIVIQTAYGQRSSDTWQLAHASGVLGPKALAQNPSIRDTMYVKMVAYLYPGTLLLPYLAEPFCLGMGQYFIFKWLIRSNPSIGIQAAENLLLPVPYDLTRYGDVVISVTCCILVLFIGTPDVYQIFLYLIFMLVFCYGWDHWRLLRMTPRCFQEDSKLDDFSIMMLSLPCALLAAAVVFRKYGAHKDPHMTRDTVPIWCFAAFFMHLAVHLAVCIFILARDKKTNDAKEEDHAIGRNISKDDKCLHVTYEKAAEDIAYNWFNTNFVHCLRSKYIYKNTPTWCVPAKCGREYLLMRQPELGLFYEAPGSVAPRSVRSDFKAFAKDVKHHAKEAQDAAFGATSWVARGSPGADKTSPSSGKAESPGAGGRPMFRAGGDSSPSKGDDD